MFKKINLLTLAIGCVLHYSAVAQATTPKKDSLQLSITNLGKGTVHVRQSGFAPGAAIPDILSNSDDSLRFMDFKFVYYVKHPLVMRNDMLHRDSDKRRDVNMVKQTTLVRGQSAPVSPIAKKDINKKISKSSDAAVTMAFAYEMVHPIYWINWEQQQLYMLSGKKDFIARLPLQGNSKEAFYSWIGTKDSSSMVIDSLREDRTLMIAGKLCYQGTASYADEKYLFYYTREKLPVFSPLNAYFPSSFPYAVMSFTAPTDWNSFGKPVTGAYIVTQITFVDAVEPDDKLMAMPSGLPVRDSITPAEISGQ